MSVRPPSRFALRRGRPLPSRFVLRRGRPLPSRFVLRRGRPLRVVGTALLILAMAMSVRTSNGAAEEGELWTFDRLDRIGGHPTTVLGSPRLIDTPLGKAVEFNGVDSALVVDVHPLAGAATFTWEAIFRPDGGEQAQRWLHLQETGTENRMLFELRNVDNQWYFDSFVYSGMSSKALIDPKRLHPQGAWYHVAGVYDGREFRNYVNGVQEGAAEIHFDPQRAGKTSVGVRMNLVNYFKGAIRTARFTKRALSPAEFLALPAR